MVIVRHIYNMLDLQVQTKSLNKNTYASPMMIIEGLQLHSQMA